MWSNRWKVLLAGGVLLVTTGCATSEEWATWQQSPGQWASFDHFLFSVRNTERNPRVTREDLAKSREQGWWGQTITVAQDQILER
jgi:hypothetical protein